MPSLGSAGDLMDPQWARSPTGRFHRFIHLDPEERGLSGVTGVFVLWHGGVKPEWVYVAKAKDLAAALHEVAKDEDVMYYEVRGGLFVTWSPILPQYQDGVVRFLAESLKPVIENPAAVALKAKAIPVFPPAYHP
jgi:hypothetical protein